MKRVVALGLVAVALAIAAAVGVANFLSGAESRALAGYTMIQLISVRDTVPAGTTLGDAQAQGLIGTLSFPQDYAPANALKEVSAEQSSQVTLSELSAGQLVMDGDFVTPPPSISVLSIPRGNVAVTIELGEAQHVSTFVEVGSHVAVTSGVRVLFPSLEVLAVSGNLITLAVNPSQVPSLTFAAQESKVYLALLGGKPSLRSSPTASPTQSQG